MSAVLNFQVCCQIRHVIIQLVGCDGIFDVHIPFVFIISYKVNDMIAIIGFYNTCITRLTGSIKAPIIEIRYHLTFFNSFIQTAICIGTCIIAVCLGKLCKAVFCRITALPVFQNLLSLHLCSCLCSCLGLFLCFCRFCLCHPCLTCRSCFCLVSLCRIRR